MSLLMLALALSSALASGQQPDPPNFDDLRRQLEALQGQGGQECLVTLVGQHMHIQACDCERESLKAWGFYSSSRWPWTPTPDTRARCCCFWDRFHCLLQVLEEAHCRTNVIEAVRQMIEERVNVPQGYNVTFGCDVQYPGVNCRDFRYGAATCNSRPSNLVFWLIFAAIVAVMVCVAIGSYWWFCTEPTYSIPTYAPAPEGQPGCCEAKNATPVGLKYNASQELGSGGALTGQTKPGKSDEYVIDVKCGE